MGGCRGAQQSLLLLVDKVGVDDKFRWRWVAGDATTLADFGDPVGGATAYRLCVYDDDNLVLQLDTPAGGTCRDGRACWATTRRGYRYVDKDLTAHGIPRIDLFAGDQGEAQIVFRGRSPNLSLPGPVSADAYFNFTSSVRVQLLRSDDSTCWESELLPPARKNRGTEFRGYGRP